MLFDSGVGYEGIVQRVNNLYKALLILCAVGENGDPDDLLGSFGMIVTDE